MRLRKQQLVGLVWVWGPRRSWLGNRTWQSSHGKVSNKHTRLNSLWTLEQHTIRLWNDKPDCECLNVCKYVSGLGVLLLLAVVPRSPLESHINSTLFCLCRSSIVEAVPQWPCLDLGACSPEHGAWSMEHPLLGTKHVRDLCCWGLPVSWLFQSYYMCEWLECACAITNCIALISNQHASALISTRDSYGAKRPGNYAGLVTLHPNPKAIPLAQFSGAELPIIWTRPPNWLPLIGLINSWRVTKINQRELLHIVFHYSHNAMVRRKGESPANYRIPGTGSACLGLCVIVRQE